MNYPHREIEHKWQKAWQESGVYEPDLDAPKRKFYNLMMFPYPSAEGLHVGNVYAFTGSDIYGRYMRMKGYDVFEPIGLDGFGIHSENYALKTGVHPLEQAQRSEARFYEQLRATGNGFAWKEHLETYAPEYYHWTQWLFVQMWKHRLAYRKKQAVNWCPKDKTVLADEQVVAGKCERCGTVVEEKELEQWFFKITDYADRLLKNLDTIDWSEKVKVAQRNWIGKSEGALLEFPLKDSASRIEVFTTRPDTVLGATYVVLAPEHKLIEELMSRVSNAEEVREYAEQAKRKTEQERNAEGRVKTGVELRGVTAVHPVTGRELPVWVADYVLSGYGTGAIMAVPSDDERDKQFAEAFGLPIVDTQRIDKGEAVKRMGGEHHIHYHLRDWLISRQRYWGPPIPMLYCAPCAAAGKGEQKEMPGWYAVPEEDLPVLLPRVMDFHPEGKGESPLASVREFYEVKCPACGALAHRETDVSDTFLDSAWYYLRYVDPANTAEPFSAKRMRAWLPVDMYIGGAEHAVLHLLYVRFVTMALHDWEFLGFEEPFTKFRAHGLIIKEGAKMSKSRGNVINPDEYIEAYGADALRMYLMFLAPFEQGGDFRDSAVKGIARFLNRVWDICQKGASGKSTDEFTCLMHESVKRVGDDIRALKYNTAISQLMIFLNGIEKTSAPKAVIETFLLLLAPFAPHITEELWHILGHTTSIHAAAWPTYDESALAATAVKLVVQVNGKVRDTVTIALTASQDDAVAAALASERIKTYIPDASRAKIIYIPGKVLNFVIK